jgi:hypothetical protein
MQPPSTLNLDKGPPIPLPPSEIAKGPIPPAGANPTFPTAKDPLYGDPIIPKTPGTLDVKSPLPPLGADPNIKPPQNPLPPLQGDKPPISPIVPGNAAPSPVGVGSVPPVMGGKDPTPPGIISQNPTQPNPAPAPIPTPVGQPAPASKAQVEQHMETIYTCTAADADFAALSQKFYNGSDKYAQALVEYNKRSNPFGKDAVALAPRVQPGTKVIVPPVHVLEREFPAAVSSSKQPLGEMPKPVDLAPTGPPKSLVPVTNGPASGQAVPATQPPTEPWGMPKSPAPSPVQPVQTPAIPAPSQPPATFPGPSGLTPPTGPLSSNAATPGVYVVPPPGKHYWQIAQETLGDPKRWSEIFNLNQHYNPEQMVPAGAQLRLPGASTPVVNAGGDPRAPFLN